MMSPASRPIRRPPAVLCLSGHDPTGGAGIQADIEAVRAFGAHPVTVVTALTAQDSRNVFQVYPQPPAAFKAQLQRLVADVEVSVVKIGLLGSVAVAEVILDLLETLGPIPVILDPILAAGGGSALADDPLFECLRDHLLPKTDWLTPNLPELYRLSGRDEPEAAADQLLLGGVRQLLVTGAHAPDAEVINHWFYSGGQKSWRWPRLSGDFHGSGCTLAAALAAALARGDPDFEAVERAQIYTQRVLSRAYPLGQGQWIPGRWSKVSKAGWE